MLSNHSQPLGIYQYREIYPTLLTEGHVSFREIGVIIGTQNDYVHNFSNAEQSLPAPRNLPIPGNLPNITD